MNSTRMAVTAATTARVTRNAARLLGRESAARVGAPGDDRVATSASLLLVARNRPLVPTLLIIGRRAVQSAASHALSQPIAVLQVAACRGRPCRRAANRWE